MPVTRLEIVKYGIPIKGVMSLPVGKRYYYRTFIVLREWNKGYQSMAGKSPMGYCKMEFRGTRGRIVLTVQNLRPVDQGSYSCILVSREDGIAKTYEFGTLKVDRRGRGETVWEFDRGELDGVAVSEYKAICVAYIPPAARRNTDIHFPLVGYSEKGMRLSWESDIAETVYASKFPSPSSVQADGEDTKEAPSIGQPESLREEQPKKEKEENIPPKLPPKEEKKEENIPPKLPPKEEKKEENVPPKLPPKEKEEENIPPKAPAEEKEELPEEKKEENIPPKLPPKEEKKEENVPPKLPAEEKKEENIPPKLPAEEKKELPEEKKEENIPPKLPPKEKKEENIPPKLPPKKEKKGDYWDSVKDYFDHLFNTQPKVQPFEQEIPNSEWVQIQYGPHYPSPYGGDGYMYGYVQSYGGYNYYIAGLIRENDRVKYICYGIPGPYSVLPPAGWQGFSSWVPANGYYGMGYWMMYLDAATGQTVQPN